MRKACGAAATLLRTAALSLGAELIDSLTASSSACLSEGSRLRSFARSAGKDSEWLLALIPRRAAAFLRSELEPRKLLHAGVNYTEKEFLTRT